ncbi:MAG: ribulose-phosphate 3-epimerase [Chlamydiales bacterium]|nr:ribulose-phosphate 3-epimerase [Chlamydiia bacterium]MCP5503534.1 ribulose-phosphate 3-epimerase [Chlamydiales bacterium]
MTTDNQIYIEPSIFAADFGYLADEAKRAEQAGADAIHFDIMDGHFVPNLSLSPKGLAAINRATDLYLDVHIMVYHPYDYIERLVENGADCITFHVEATEDVEDTLNYIRTCNVHAGLAFCPETSESLIPKYLDKCDKMLLMTVHPGFGGQAFIPEVLDKIEFARSLCDKLNIRKGGKVPKEGEILPPFDIQVDGGIDDKTAPLAIKAGANHLVAGTYLFKGEDMKEKIKGLRG